MKEKIDHWKTIEEIGWDRKSLDYNALAREWFGKLGKEGMKALNQFVSKRVSELWNAVKDYEEVHGSLDCGSDDSFSDVTYHIVGLGYLEWSRAVQTPCRVAVRYGAGKYKESFAYIFNEPEPERTEEDKEKTFQSMLDQIGCLEQAVKRADNALNELKIRSLDLCMTVSLVKQDHQDKKSA